MPVANSLPPRAVLPRSANTQESKLCGLDQAKLRATLQFDTESGGHITFAPNRDYLFRRRTFARQEFVRIGRTLQPRQMYAIVIRPERTRKIAMTEVLSVRVSEEERALLQAASELARTSLSDFVRRKALDAAELDMTERRIVTIPAKDWKKFEAWANEPAAEIRELRELARKAATWQE